MSLLPQQKKSAEEIARLRESLGIPSVAPEEPVQVPQLAPPPPVEGPVTPPAVVRHRQHHNLHRPGPDEPHMVPIPVNEPVDAKAARLSRPSDGIPVLPVILDGAPAVPHHPHPPESPVLPASSPLPVAPSLKPVRSLRKSEKLPLPVLHQPPPADSKLPRQRHNDEELQRIRHQEAIALAAKHVEPPRLTAHLAMVITGYLFAIAGVVCYYFYELQMVIPAACVACGFFIAAFIFFCRPLSRHHAAFIAVIALFVTVFGALYYFPQLSYGSLRPLPDEKTDIPTH